MVFNKKWLQIYEIFLILYAYIYVVSYFQNLQKYLTTQFDGYGMQAVAVD